MQHATKYFAPRMFKDFHDAVKGTPLLPRDIMTMMLANRLTAFRLPDGRILWPMPARKDVQTALEILGGQEGDVLTRSDGTWKPSRISAGGQSFQTIADIDIAGQSEAVWPIPEGMTAMIVAGIATRTASGTAQLLQFSVDGGASFIQTDGAYWRGDEQGENVSQTGFYLQPHSASNNRSYVLPFFQSAPDVPLVGFHPVWNRTYWYLPTDEPINAARVLLTKAGTFTSGRLLVMALA